MMVLHTHILVHVGLNDHFSHIGVGFIFSIQDSTLDLKNASIMVVLM